VFCSNDYLGLAAEPPDLEALLAGVPSGSGASALVTGWGELHSAASEALGAWLGYESVLLFPSTYAANVGVLQALAGADALIVSDELNHASIVDGCRLSRAEVKVVPHLDLGAVEAALAKSAPDREAWIVSESYFSMDGDSPDVRALREIADRYGAGLILDEAHALGVWGPAGRGCAAEDGVCPDVLVGSLGKSMGLQGGFVASRASVGQWLWNKARSFVFSTAMSPWLAAMVPSRVQRVAEADDRRRLIQEHSAVVRRALAGTARGRGPIIPWVIGRDADATERSRELSESGFVVQAIRPPTVPEGTARLRLTVSAGHAPREVEELAGRLADMVSRETIADMPR
jgi:8-amino-7-oxononanoate synthase